MRNIQYINDISILNKSYLKYHLIYSDYKKYSYAKKSHSYFTFLILFCYICKLKKRHMKNIESYIDALQDLGFLQADSQRSSIFFTKDINTYIESEISPYIIIALDKAKHFKVDAVYFRFFDDDRAPIAQIYIYDNITNRKNREEYAKWHKAIWSSGEVPLFYIINNNSIEIFDSRKPIKIEKDKELSHPIDVIKLSEIDHSLRKYNAEMFNNGCFWDLNENSNHFLNNKVASERLVNGLHEVRNILHKSLTLPSELVDRLLIICILIKYLEENGVDKELNINLAHDFFYKATGFSTLEEILANNKLTDLLDKLAFYFNGGIFSIDKTFHAELQNADISSIALFFEANYTNNLFGWREYSFEYIPVELISNFYEELLSKKETKEVNENKKTSGAVYTPSFLVNLLIDESLPLSLNENDLNENIKLIDPACGSGIFLVTAYKRLVQRWRLKHRMNGKLADTNPKILKEILIKNIHGIDINKNAVNLSIFSLQLALCSMLTPRQIWTELGHFDNLTKDNIIHFDFFQFLIDKTRKKDFDIVIGNPPFSRKTLGGKSMSYYQQLLENEYPIKFINQEEEFALLFLEKAMHLLKIKQGKLCFILPSGPLLYFESTSEKYRRGLFKEYSVDQIIDFTYLRRILFKATVSTLAIFVSYRKPMENDDILHIVAKRTKTSKEKSYFEFDYYDFHRVPRNISNNKPNVWKCNLLGGDIVYNLIKKITKNQYTLSGFLKDNHITSISSVKKNSFEKYSINEKKRKNTQGNLFEFFTEEPLISETETGIWAIRKKITHGIFPTEVSVFDFKKSNSFDGISYVGNKDTLKLFRDYILLNSKTICFYIAATSGRQGIRSPYVINTSDMDDFPFQDQLDKLLSPTDHIIISDVCNFILEDFGNGEKASVNRNNAQKEDLENFSSVYCNSINQIYGQNKNKYLLSKITESSAYYICDYSYTDKKNIEVKYEKSELSLDNLLFQWNFTNTKKINRILRIYTHDSIKIIKPKLLRYWLMSKALRDADDTFVDILS